MVVFLSRLLVISNNKILCLCIQIAVILCLIVSYGYYIYCQVSQCSYPISVPSLPRKMLDISCTHCLLLATIIAIISIFKMAKIINGLPKSLKPLSIKHFVWVKICLNLSDTINWIVSPLISIAYLIQMGWNRGCLIPVIVAHFLFVFFLIRILFMSNMVIDHFVEINNLLLKQETKVDHLKVKSVAIIANIQVNHHCMHLRYLEALEHITEQFQDLYNNLDLFNSQIKYFHVLALVGNIGIFLKAWINITESSFDSVNSADGFWNFIGLCVLCVNNFSHAALTAYVGERLQYEGHRTTRICYDILNKLPIEARDKKDKWNREQLQLLLDQSKSRRVYLHSGGFFKLNWNILGTIVTTVATYSIVITQFELK